MCTSSILLVVQIGKRVDFPCSFQLLCVISIIMYCLIFVDAICMVFNKTLDMFQALAKDYRV